jgi:type IV pilus assembly protein PilV
MRALRITRRRGASSIHAGFTLLEVLVTLFVIAMALLGTAGLQAYAMKFTQSGQMRTQAVILGSDLLERLEANNEAAILGAYVANPLPTVVTVDCDAAACTQANLAVYDLVQFGAKLAAELPSSTATVAVAGAGPWTYTLQINWVERIAKASTTTVSGGGSTENFSYTISRTIYDQAIII